MKTLLKFITAILILCSTQIDAQESIKPLRIGAKIGVPNIISANLEYVTPLLDNRVSIMLDYMSLSKTVDDVNVNYNNFEIGSNIYINNTGKGFYGGISYFSFNAEGTYSDVEFDSGTNEGTANIEFNTINLKIGAKLGRTFFFRIEAGYGLGEIPEYVVVKSNSNNETSIEEIPEVPGISESGLPVFNIGIGFSFM
ncbi:hypothetical protein [Lacinutrix sp. Bg11-31]|uniref:hypothetical protein n=1 Tax=Lacinutrix sp. Bg11-31 TaxID=2057808 RepID=UPI000C317C64|nr:hypothetical protein [Lacinutrix sp. Bg11-31]AUC82200.1 hypothetical protein CW733_08685 [Lacinutrix sp. Bg11-31]